MQPNFEEVIGRQNKNLLAMDFGPLDNQKIAIVGGAGSIGLALGKYLHLNSNAHLGLFDLDESRLHSARLELSKGTKRKLDIGLIDIRNRESIGDVFVRFAPNVVIHAAALKHVSFLEDWPRDAYLTNVLGTANLKWVSDNIGVERFLFISTDKAVNPTSILGKSKLIGEYLTSWAPREKPARYPISSVVRFGNVFLSRGSVLETFLFQIENNLPLTLSDRNATRYFIDLSEAANLILRALLTRPNMVNTLDMGSPVKILDMVERLLGVYKKNNPIIEIGLKSGEKLHEELFVKIEATSVNPVDGIYSESFEKSISLEKVISMKIPTISDSKLIMEQLLHNAEQI
jgi:FlaA1/EpsC-like NDP-sugar epimerase